MRTNPVRRWFLIGLLPWLGTMLLAAEIVRNQNLRSAQTSSNNVFTEIKQSPVEAIVLPVTGEKNRWRLPISNPREGWMIAVGMVSPGGVAQEVTFSARSTGQSLAGQEHLKDRNLLQANLLERNPEQPASPNAMMPKKPKTVVAPKSNRSFSIQTRSGDSGDPAFYESIRAELARTGETVSIYVDIRDKADVTRETLATIVRIMDEVIPALVIPKIGHATDTDGDGRLTILISQALGRMADGAAVLDGFVRPTDFDPSVPLPRGQACDMIYINSRVTSPDFLKSLLAHEFTHAVVASARLRAAAGSADTGEESWLDEGLAHLSERWVDGSWENLDYRVSSYLLATHEHPLVVNEAHGLGAARGHGHRGAAFLFLSWCQARFGPGLPMKLAQSARSGLANLEAATRHDFATLFRAWSMDLLQRSAALASAHQIRSQALLSEWLVATPKAKVIELGDSDESALDTARWDAAPTTVRLFHLKPDPIGSGAGVVEILLDCDQPQSVQVTAIRLTDRHHGLEVQASPAGGDASLSANSNQVRLTLTNRDPQRSLTLQAAAWESVAKHNDARSLRQNRGFYDLLALARMTGSIKLEPGQTLVTPPISLDQTSGRVVWKIVAHDPAGKPYFAWAEVDAKPPAVFPPRLAESIDTNSSRILRR